MTSKHEAERANWDIYDDFKLKKKHSVFIIYVNICDLLTCLIYTGLWRVYVISDNLLSNRLKTTTVAFCAQGANLLYYIHVKNMTACGYFQSVFLAD